MKYLIFSLSILLNSATHLSAELPPGSIDAMKKEAQEVVEVEVTAVETPGTKGPHKTVIYTATVLKVERSKANIKSGASIQIKSYFLSRPKVKPLTNPNPTPEEFAQFIESHEIIVGPKPPPFLNKGWKGKIYLNAGNNGGRFNIAAHGHSFEAK
jgi:hypothetical protein